MNFFKKGVLLAYSLIVAALLSIFIAVAVSQMQYGVFLTKKFNAETKAYWAARAGLDYAQYKLLQDPKWPFSSAGNSNTVFGPYTVSEEHLSGDKCVISAKDSDGDIGFYMIFSKKLERNAADDSYSILPDGFSYAPAHQSPLLYFSMNTLAVENLPSEDEEERYFVRVSQKDNHCAYMMPSSVYIAADGRCGAYKCVVEKLFKMDLSGTFDGGIYAGRNIAIDLHGKGAAFNVEQLGNGRPNIFCKNNFEVFRDLTHEYRRDSPAIKPCNVGDGKIYYGNNFEIREGYSTQPLSPEDIDFKRKQGVTAEKMSVPPPEFPKISWDTVAKTSAASLPAIESGTYVFVPHPVTGQYKLMHFPGIYLNPADVMGGSSEFLLSQRDVANGVNYGYQDAKNIANLPFDAAQFEDYFQNTDYKGGKPNTATALQNLFGQQKPISWKVDYSSNVAKPRMVIDRSAELMNTEVAGQPVSGLAVLALERNSSNTGYVFATSVRPELRVDGKAGPKSIFSLFRPSASSDSVVLYTPKLSSVSVKGLVSGTGQFVTGNMIFEAGSELGSAKDDHIAIYSAGSVNLKYVSARKNLNVDAYVLSAIAGLYGRIDSMVDAALLKQVSYQDPGDGKTKTGELKLVLESFGYSVSDARDLVKNTVSVNAERTGNLIDLLLGYYRIPSPASALKKYPRSPSCFKGVIYTWGSFYADTDYGDFNLQGAIVAFGADPVSGEPGAANAGDIRVNDCTNFKIIYDPMELSQFIKPDDNSVKINKVYMNRL